MYAPGHLTESSDATPSIQSLDRSSNTLLSASASTKVAPYIGRDLIRDVRAILAKVSVKPKPEIVSCRYTKDELRSKQRYYVIPKDLTTRKGTVGFTEIQLLAVILPRTLRELRTVAIQCTHYTEVGRTLIGTLMHLEQSKLYLAWVFKTGEERWGRSMNHEKGTRATQGKTVEQKQRRLADDKRSRYRRRIRTHFLDLLWLIDDWVKQVKLPNIGLESRRYLEEVCVELSNTAKVIQTRFAETVPWTSSV